ncbi:T9SS type A sorting domain-containing protein [Aureispira anguillae]|nr:T9SS type A sorting domain-containing protein [Aureispira anguillae]
MQTKLHFLILCLGLVLSNLEAQIAYHGFEQNAGDTWGTTLSTVACTNGSDRWDYSTALSSITPAVGAQFWGVQDLNGNCGGAAGETITFANVSVATYTGVSIQFDYNIVGYDSGDNVFYTVILDGVAQPQVQLVTGGGFSTGGYLTETINIPNSANTVGLELLVVQNGGSDYAGFDNFILDGTPTVVCPHTITSFAPTSGPIGTEVTISGTGFTASSTVEFNGVAAAVTFVDATTLIATLPTGATTGTITVIETACNQTTAGNFTLLTSGGACGSILTDIIISEVFDNNGGSLGYIEIYNGTGATIDLTNYRIDRYGTLTSGTVTHSYTFPATGTGSSIADGQVLVGRINSGGSGVQDFDFGGTTAGFNADDRLELVHVPTTTVIDDFHDATVGAVGYIYRRNNTVTGPNPTFAAGEWTTATSGDETHLGIFTVGGGTPTITTQPTDVSGCAMNFSVAATAGNGGALTYQWFYNENDGSALTWTAVSAAAFAGAVVTGETSNALSISGVVSSFDGYQFYCQVTEGGTCNLPSEAVQFTLNAERFFRSVNTGNWTNVATWEMASSAAGPWSSACIYPEFDNSDYIHILNTHTVSVDQDLVVDEVVIESGGTLAINNNRLLRFNNGTGVDLDIQGTLIDNGNGGGNGVDFGTHSATWILAANGEIIKTGTSSIAQYRDNYEGGIATIPATATWRYRQSGNSSTVAVITLNMFYPNLYLEATSGSHSFNAASEIFQGTSGFMTVKGNMYIGNSGTGTVDVFNTNTNASLLQVMGDLIIGGNGSAGTSKLENNQGGVIGTGIEVHGNLMIHNNGQLDMEDGTAAADGLVRLHGNWTDQNTGNGFDEGESIVEFLGTTTQSVNKATGSESFYQVIVNKAGGNLQNNASDMVIKNDMTFTNGIVLTSAAAYLVFDPIATATNASNFSHVDGPVIKETNTGAITNFTYPTGDNGVYGAIGIETRFHHGEFYIAEYFYQGYGTYNVNAAELDHVSSLEYWMLDELIGGTGEHLKVTLHWGPHSNVISPSSMRVGHFFTQAPSVVNQWEREGNSPVITGTVVNGTVTSDYVTSFSPFTLADMLNQISLPLELLRFDATKVERTTKLEWEVANEKAGDRYCLQRSADAQNFETLACFDATSDNNQAFYNYIDQTPLVGHNYYRIHHIDYAGVNDYSRTRVVTFEDPNAMVLVYPSPADDRLTIELPLLSKGNYAITMIDALGRILMQSELTNQQSIYTMNTEKLTAGTYVIQVHAPNGSVHTEKVTIRH